MASSYPPPPTGWEFVFDIDGTIVRRDSGAAWDSTKIKTSNDYDPSTTVENVNSDLGVLTISWYFPQARTITGASFAYGGASSNLSVSSDTTDGVNGTWIVVIDHAGLSNFRSLTTESLRTPATVNWTNVKAVKLYSNNYPNFRGGHLWGTYATNSLQMWHPTLDQPLTSRDDCDHGDMLRGAISNKDFRVKNLTAQTANDIVVSIQTPEIGGALGGSELIYSAAPANSHNIGNLAANAISSIITMQRTMGVAQTYGSKGTVRVTAIATSWT